MFDGDGDGYGDAEPPEEFDVGTDCDDKIESIRWCYRDLQWCL